jgi:hypothetical protein
VVVAEQSWHELVDVHAGHVFFGVAEQSAHVLSQVLNPAFFLHQVNQNRAIVRAEDIDLGFVRKPLFEQLGLGDFF